MLPISSPQIYDVIPALRYRTADAHSTGSGHFDYDCGEGVTTRADGRLTHWCIKSDLANSPVMLISIDTQRTLESTMEPTTFTALVRGLQIGVATALIFLGGT